MKIELIKDIAQITGVAGIAVATSLFIFKGVMQSINSKKYTSAQSFTLTKYIIITSGILGIAGLFAWTITEINIGKNKKSAKYENKEKEPKTNAPRTIELKDSYYLIPKKTILYDTLEFDSNHKEARKPKIAEGRSIIENDGKSFIHFYSGEKGFYAKKNDVEPLLDRANSFFTLFRDVSICKIILLELSQSLVTRGEFKEKNKTAVELYNNIEEKILHISDFENSHFDIFPVKKKRELIDEAGKTAAKMVEHKDETGISAVMMSEYTSCMSRKWDLDVQ